MVVCSVYIKIWIQVRTASRNSKGSVSLMYSKLSQVVRVAEGPSLRQDNGLRRLKANLVCGRVKPIGNGSVEQSRPPQVQASNESDFNIFIRIIES